MEIYDITSISRAWAGCPNMQLRGKYALQDLRHEEGNSECSKNVPCNTYKDQSAELYFEMYLDQVARPIKLSCSEKSYNTYIFFDNCLYFTHVTIS